MSSSQRINHNIMVSDNKVFSEPRWREAILYFLFGLWGNNPAVVRRPKIRLGTIDIARDPQGFYYAYGRPDPRELESYADSWTKGRTAVVHGDYSDQVEAALVRFVKDKEFVELVLSFQTGRVMLWKTKNRGDYGITAEGLPLGWSSKGPRF